MKGFKKNDIEIYYDRDFHSGKPSVNVKVYHFAKGLTEDDFPGCSEEQFQKASEYSFEMGQEGFWDNVQETCDYYLKEGKVFSAGRSGGHLIVDGLDNVETWDAVMVNRWALFERAINREIAYLCSKEKAREDIKANRWCEEGAERYNFFDGKNGETKCISELKKEAREKRYGAVLR